MSENRKPSIIYINKWIVMLAIIVTASLGFFLGFVIGKNYNQKQIKIASSAPVNISPKETEKKLEVQKQEVTNELQPNELKKDNQSKVVNEAKNADFKKEGNFENVKNYVQNKQNKSIMESNNTKKYTIQAGAFKKEVEAIALKSKLKKKGYDVSISISKTKNNGKLYKVKVGEFSSREEAENICNKLKRNEGIKPFVTIK